MRGFNAKSSYTHLVLANSKVRVPSYLGSSILQVCYFHKKGTAPNTCAYIRFPEPSSDLPNEHVSDSNIRGQDLAWQVVLHMR